jgi:hypothetical protein
LAHTASGGKDWFMASDYNSRGHQGQLSASEEGGYQGQDQLAQQLSELARNLHREDTVQDTLMGIVRAVVDNVPRRAVRRDQPGGGPPKGHHSGMER